MRTLFQELKDHSAAVADSPAVARTFGRARGPGGSAPGANTMPLDAVQSALYRADKADSEQRLGNSDALHASAFTRNPLCPRLYVLARGMRKAGAVFRERIFGSQRLVWAYGRATETHVRAQFASMPEWRGKMYGVWRCMCGKTADTGLYDDTRKCPVCDSGLTVYDELPMSAKGRLLTGSCDMAMMHDDAIQIFEIKSIKQNSTAQHPGFDDVDTPLFDHGVQGTHYRDIWRANGFRVYDRPAVIYVRKEFDTKNWYKFLVPSDTQQAHIDETVKEHQSVADDYRDALRDGAVPPKIAQCQDNPEACRKTCPVWVECVSQRDAV